MHKNPKTFEEIHENELEASAVMESLKDTVVSFGMYVNTNRMTESPSSPIISEIDELTKQYLDALYLNTIESQRIIKDDFLKQYRELAKRHGK